jgi:formylglycine-generating enzyme required for sulfatase activity
MIVPPTIVVPCGSFFLGAVSSDKYADAAELPRRRVEVGSFEMGIHPVTNLEWAAFASGLQGDLSLPVTNDPKLPVTNVSWHDAQAYLAWLRCGTGKSWRLPTEIEWEYACRAGSETLFPQGEDLSPIDANFLYDESLERIGPGHLTPVGFYPSNAWGFHDLLGNVNEWTSSPWTRSHELLATIVPGLFTIRGGSWDGLPRLLRPSWRDGLAETTRSDHLGFRVARGG